MEDFEEINVTPSNGTGNWLENMLFSDTFFTIFFSVVALLVVAGVVTTVVLLIRGKKRRYILMRVDDDGTLSPVPTKNSGGVGGPGMHAGDAAMRAHNEAHQQALTQQAINQQNITQQGLNNP